MSSLVDLASAWSLGLRVFDFRQWHVDFCRLLYGSFSVEVAAERRRACPCFKDRVRTIFSIASADPRHHARRVRSFSSPSLMQSLPRAPAFVQTRTPWLVGASFVIAQPRPITNTSCPSSTLLKATSSCYNDIPAGVRRGRAAVRRRRRRPLTIPDAAGAPSTHASPPTRGSKRSSTRSTRSARLALPTLLARSMRDGLHSLTSMTTAVCPVARSSARRCSGFSPASSPAKFKSWSSTRSTG